MQYFIRKASRDSDTPYQGSTCDAAGVTAGQWYETIADAEIDAAKLSLFNAIGFDVVDAAAKIRISRWFDGQRWEPDYWPRELHFQTTRLPAQ
jgi:hypothetical protein